MFFTKYEELSKKHKKTTTGVALELGIAKSTVAYWRANNNVIPKQEILIKIADYFGVTVDYLLGKEETNKPIITESDIKVALFGGNDADVDKKFEDVKRYIEFLNSKKD